MAKRLSTQELRQENARLTIALNAAYERLELYETFHDIATGWIVGEVIKADQPVLVRSKNVIYAITLTVHDVKPGERYIFPLLIDGYFDSQTKKHQVVFHCDRAIPTAVSDPSIMLPKDLLMLHAFTAFLNTSGKTV